MSGSSVWEKAKGVLFLVLLAWVATTGIAIGILLMRPPTIQAQPEFRVLPVVVIERAEPTPAAPMSTGQPRPRVILQPAVGDDGQPYTLMRPACVVGSAEVEP